MSKGDLETRLDQFSEYRIKKALRKLLELNLLTATGNGRSVKYALNMSTAEGLGQIRLMMDRLSELLSTK